ncbi:cation:proton antiporter domain-containing protein [Streptomyces lavenduligriseus]|uniref:Cation:proton antiporter n=1 Tax=Streptomyces lavenduligriseus TaxID=67315 RepID=A0ABT0NKH2_9ACTN|nr:cation:proton antiporter [Streptomyces lavenduligriseus]MCL3991969.1 cation:proton antiporter [Streptomyces lavenduligriseus]
MTTNQLFALFCDLALIIVLARILGAVAQRFSQPAVIGEVLAGILLGPTFLGHSVPDFLFPPGVRPMLTALADVGMAVFMFIVGLELDRKILRGTGRLAVTVAVSCILLPFGLGTLLALMLADDHAQGHRLGFVLFMGTAMSVTAFPVLARILTDRKMQHTPIGGLALACAAIGDVLAWCMLAAVVALVSGGGGDQWLLLLLVPYAGLMVWVVRPLLRRLVAAGGSRLTPAVLTVVLAGLLVSGAVTERIGLHFIFGAFLFGVVMPKESTERLRADIIDRIGDVSGQLLQPVFFIIVGLKVDLSDLGGSGWLDFALILLVAVTGKFVGAFLSARAFRVTARQSAVLATLMNTRGLTELIILTAGLQLGVLDERLYSLMVVMAVVTTAMAGPLLAVLRPRALADQDPVIPVRDARSPATKH